MEIDNTIDACICGHDDEINFYKLTYATQVIIKTGKFFGTNIDTRSLRDDKVIPGTYGFICMLEKFSEIKAKIITKPNPISLDIIMQKHNIDAKDKHKFLMIGDNVNTDIEFANNCGIDSLLLFSGVTSFDKFKHFEDNFDQYYESERNIFPTYYTDKMKL